MWYCTANCSNISVCLITVQWTKSDVRSRGSGKHPGHGHSINNHCKEREKLLLWFWYFVFFLQVKERGKKSFRRRCWVKKIKNNNNIKKKRMICFLVTHCLYVWITWFLLPTEERDRTGYIIPLLNNHLIWTDSLGQSVESHRRWVAVSKRSHLKLWKNHERRLKKIKINKCREQ